MEVVSEYSWHKDSTVVLSSMFLLATISLVVVSMVDGCNLYTGLRVRCHNKGRISTWVHQMSLLFIKRDLKSQCIYLQPALVGIQCQGYITYSTGI
jgi:hypothetical protein